MLANTFQDSAKKTAVIPLLALDSQASVANIPFVFFFENALGSSSSSKSFMPTELLLSSLERALAEFPILQGHLVANTSGDFAVSVDSETVNKPKFGESHSNLHFADLRDKGYDWSLWPVDLLSKDVLMQAMADSIIKLLDIHVVRFRDDSGVAILVCIPHAVVDGRGYFAFVNRWAEICRQTATTADTSGVLSSSPLLVDRELVMQSVRDIKPSELGELAMAPYQHSWFADILSYLSPARRGWLLSTLSGLAKADCHIFRIKQSTLDEIRDDIAEHVPKGVRISDNDIICGLVGKVFAQAQSSNRVQSATGIITYATSWLSSWFHDGTNDAQQLLTVALDIRHRVGIPLNYTGNSMLGVSVQNSLRDMASPITSKSLAEAALSVRRAVDSFDKRTIAAQVNVACDNPSWFTRPIVNLTSKQHSVIFSNQTRFEMYRCNFGYGRPARVAGAMSKSPNLVTIIPSGSGRAPSVDVMISATPCDMERIMGNEYWMSKVGLIM
ncbi:hypothetical protein GQ42DRAFT_142334 [Ramicandelaber brevisporus]|nr:hypothetical protein GQ42DRAFT_142334 [Ramicandelaber brevisporus]